MTGYVTSDLGLCNRKWRRPSTWHPGQATVRWLCSCCRTQHRWMPRLRYCTQCHATIHTAHIYCMYVIMFYNKLCPGWNSHSHIHCSSTTVYNTIHCTNTSLLLLAKYSSFQPLFLLTLTLSLHPCLSRMTRHLSTVRPVWDIRSWSSCS